MSKHDDSTPDIGFDEAFRFATHVNVSWRQPINQLFSVKLRCHDEPTQIGIRQWDTHGFAATGAGATPKLEVR